MATYAMRAVCLAILLGGVLLFSEAAIARLKRAGRHRKPVTVECVEHGVVAVEPNGLLAAEAWRAHWTTWHDGEAA